MRPVFESYSQSVSPANGTDIDKSVMGWARDYLSLIALRPGKYCLQLILYYVDHPPGAPEHVSEFESGLGKVQENVFL